MHCRTSQRDCAPASGKDDEKQTKTTHSRSLNDAVEVAVGCGRHAKTLDDRPTQVRHRAVATARRRVVEILTDAGRTSTFQRQ